MSETPMKISIDLVMKADDAIKKTDNMNQYVETMNQRLEQMAAAAKEAGFEIGDLTATFKMTEKVTASTSKTSYCYIYCFNSCSSNFSCRVLIFKIRCIRDFSTHTFNHISSSNTYCNL